MSSPDRRPKRLLIPEQKYDLWVRMLAGQVTQAEATEAAMLRAEVERLGRTVVEQAVELAMLRGKTGWG